MAKIKSFLTVGAMIVLPFLVNINAQAPQLHLRSGLCTYYLTPNDRWLEIRSCNVCEIKKSTPCFKDFYNYTFQAWHITQCDSFYVFHFGYWKLYKFICVRNTTKIKYHFTYPYVDRVCNNSAKLGNAEGFLRLCNQSRAHNSWTSNNSLYSSYTTPRYTKMSHTSSLYSRYSMMSDSRKSSNTVMSDTTPLHTKALNGAISPYTMILNTVPPYKLTSNTDQPYKPANPLDTVISNTGSIHQTKANTGQLYTPTNPLDTVMSNTGSTYQIKANPGSTYQTKANTGQPYPTTSNTQPYTQNYPSNTVTSKPRLRYPKANTNPTRRKGTTTTTLPTPKNVESEVEKEMAELNREDISDKRRKEVARKVINKLVNSKNLNTNKDGVKQQDLNDTVQILQKIVKLNIYSDNIDILAPASNILDDRNTKSWGKMKDDQVIRNLIVTLEKYGFQNGEHIKNHANATTGFIFRNHSNVHLHVKYINTSGHVSHEERSFTFPEASFNLSSSALPLNSSAIVVVMWYKTLHSFLTNILHDNEEINSKIITASVRPEPTEKFSQPVRISWNIKKLNDSATCVFWKPETNQKNWKSDGCFRVKKRTAESDRLICECDHLTAFAVMDISRNIVTKAERYALELISTIGCSVSLLGICLTILTHALLWKRLQHNAKTKVPSQVLMHLCGAIGMTDILAVLAGPAQNDKVFCTTVSILLYFFVLAVFGWMLCEGIIIYLQLVNVYTGLSLGGRHLKVFYIIGWGVPVAVMSLLVGLNDPNDFITKHACWCRGDGVLFWTFVGTTGLILLINLVIFFLALRNALSVSKVNTASTQSATKDVSTETKTASGTMLKKAKVGLKGSAILLPLLGLTWIFGLLVFNRETIVFKYLFAICNSLQGMMIFLFHVLINRKVHQAISREKKARNARQMFNNTAINNTPGGTLSTGEGSSRKTSIPVAPTFSKKNFNGLESLTKMEDNGVITEENKGGLKPFLKLTRLDSD